MRQKGLALVLVLWVLTLLTIMAGSFALSMRRESSIMFGMKTRAEAQAFAEAGIAVAELMMLEDDPLKRWDADGQIYEFSFDEAMIRVRILAENGKVDINRAELDLLLKLLKHATIEADMQTQVANAIIDWRDQDDETREDGAEKKEYQAAGLRYAPRNQAFQSLEELQMVLGVDAVLYEWLEPFITIESGQASVDLDKASAELRYMLESEDDFAAKPITGGSDAEDAVPRVRSFSPTEQGGEMPGEFEMLDDEQAQPGTQASGALTIVSEAMVGEGVTAGVKVLVRRSDNPGEPFSVARWQPIHSKVHSLFAYEMENY
ncbi:MAG: general secretion pathway protein GspK [Gammaproteobacteria bacterium]|nr:general secretion pathway protein GspK [Gammaproteobacteria bacterium]